jgi:hypothetical protein
MQQARGAQVTKRIEDYVPLSERVKPSYLLTVEDRQIWSTIGRRAPKSVVS